MSGTDSTYIITRDNSNNVYGAGRNRWGQLGVGSAYETQSFLIQMIIPDNKSPVEISAGSGHAVVLMSDGTVYATGLGDSGQLGIGSSGTIRISTLQKMIGIDNKVAVLVECGGTHTIVLMSDGTVYGTGSNTFGQLGRANTSNRSSLSLMTSFPSQKKANDISCGNEHTIILMTDGSIYGTGRNSSGQLGVGDYTNRTSLTLMTNTTGKTPIAVSCGAAHTIVLMSDASIYTTGDNSWGQFANDISDNNYSSLTPMTTIPAGKIPTAISGGNLYTMVLMTDGSIYAAGYNNQGNFGIGTDSTGIRYTSLTLMTTIPSGKIPVAITTSNYSTTVLMSDGSIYSAGINQYGQAAVGTLASRIPSLSQMKTNSTTFISDVVSVTRLSRTVHHSIVAKNDSIYATGDNDYGQLGIDTNISANSLKLMTIVSGLRITAISYGIFHTVVLLSNGSIYATGNNAYGQLGIGNYTNQTTLVSMTIPIGLRPRLISCGNYHTVALMTDNSIYATGNNQYGQLGIGSYDISRNTLVEMPNSTGKTPKTISCGSNHTVVLMTDGSLYGTGYNNYGQLGIGTNISANSLTLITNTTGLTPQAISCGDNHTVILMTNGVIYGVGYNAYGQLGTGDIISQTSLTIMQNTTGRTPSAVSCGMNHTMVLMTDGTLYGTGSNLYGQLGIGADISANVLTQITVPVGNVPRAISYGIGYTIVLMTDGTVYGTGRNSYGELGTGNFNNYNTLTSMTTDISGTPTPITNVSLIREYIPERQVYYTPTNLTFNTSYQFIYTDSLLLTIPNHLYYLRTDTNAIVSSYLPQDVSTNYYFANVQFNTFGTKNLSIVDASNGNAIVTSDIYLNVVEYTPNLFRINTNTTFQYIDVSNVTIPNHLYYLRSNVSGIQPISSYTAPDISRNYYFVDTSFNALGSYLLSIVDASNGNTVVSTNDISITVVPPPSYTPPQYVVNGEAFVFQYTEGLYPTTIGHQYQLVNSTYGNTVLASFTANAVSDTYTFGDGVSSVIINDLSVNQLSIWDASDNNTPIPEQNIQLISYTPYYTPTVVDAGATFTLEYTDISNVPIVGNTYYLIELPSMTLLSSGIMDPSNASYIFTDLSFDDLSSVRTLEIYDFTAQRILTESIAIDVSSLPYYIPTYPIEQDSLFTLFFYSYLRPMIPGHQYQLINTSDENRVLSTISSPVASNSYVFQDGYNGVSIHRLGINVLSIFDFTTGQTIYDQTIEIEIIPRPYADVQCNNPKYFGYTKRDSRLTCSDVLYSKVETGGNNPQISSRMRYSQLVQKK